MARVKRVSMKWCEFRTSVAERSRPFTEALVPAAGPGWVSSSPSSHVLSLTSLPFTRKRYSYLGDPGLRSSCSFLLPPIFPTSSILLVEYFINLYLDLLLKYNRYTDKGPEMYCLDGFFRVPWKYPQMEILNMAAPQKPFHSFSPNTSLE